MMTFFGVTILVTLDALPVLSDNMLWNMVWRFYSVIVETVPVPADNIIYCWSGSDVIHDANLLYTRGLLRMVCWCYQYIRY